jgi:uncharacterized protein HemY
MFIIILLIFVVIMGVLLGDKIDQKNDDFYGIMTYFNEENDE